MSTLVPRNNCPETLPRARGRGGDRKGLHHRAMPRPRAKPAEAMTAAWVLYRLHRKPWQHFYPIRHLTVFGLPP
jgi:hypothetical protein